MTINKKHYLGPIAMLLLLAFIALLAADSPETAPPSKAPGKGQTFGSRCKINGREMLFDTQARAIATAEGGMLLVAFREPSMLMIQTPKAQIGIQRLKDTQKLRLDYSRNMHSSDSQDHYRAYAGTAQSQIELKVDRMDKKEGIIAGSFSAAVLNT